MDFQRKCPATKKFLLPICYVKRFGWAVTELGRNSPSSPRYGQNKILTVGGWAAPSRPQNGPKHPKRAKKRVLAITLARRGVAGQIDPTFPCILRVPNRFREVRDPNGTLWTPYGGEGGRAWPETNFGRGPVRWSEKKIPQTFF